MITNINWNIDKEFPNLNDYKNEDRLKEDAWAVIFEYADKEITAFVDFDLTLETIVDEGDRDTPDEWEVNVTSVELTLKELYDADGDEFKLTARQFTDIENELLTQLEVKF